MLGREPLLFMLIPNMCIQQNGKHFTPDLTAIIFERDVFYIVQANGEC